MASLGHRCTFSMGATIPICDVHIRLESAHVHIGKEITLYS